MTTAESLLRLLPAVYRLRDAELAPPGERGPLFRLLDVIARQSAALDADLDQLHDDLFVETCAPWVLPYLGDLLGVSGLPTGPAGRARAVVANTVAYRRRKGTAAVLEALAHDVTAWPARAVEFFRLLATTQSMNHVRPGVGAFVDVRHADRLEFLGGPFEDVEPEAPPLDGCAKVAVRPKRRLGTPTHTADVRTIPDRRGRYNIPNVGVFVWPVAAYPLTRSPAVAVAAGDRQRFLFHPLGTSAPLFTSPLPETDYSSLAQPLNVPWPLTRRSLARHRAGCYPHSVAVAIGTRIATGDVPEATVIPLARIDVCELGDAGVGWSRTPAAGRVAIDPQLGRLVFGTPLTADEVPLVTFHYGFGGNLGGGEYDRTRSFFTDLGPPRRVANVLRPPAFNDYAKELPVAVAAARLGGVVEVVDNGRYTLADLLDLDCPRLEIRAANKCRPVIDLTDPLRIEGKLRDGKAFVEVTLNGFLIVGGGLSVNNLARLRLRHCTLVPGRTPSPGKPSVTVRTDGAAGGTVVELDHCVCGGLSLPPDSSAVVRNSILDATAPDQSAFSGGNLRVENSTVIGRVKAAAMSLASNAIFVAAGPEAVSVARRQEGCVRFSYLSPGSVTPQRHRCLPTTAAPHPPAFDSLRYGDPAYVRLALRCPAAIRRGADDESEMGAFHDSFEPQRLDHLAARLAEHTRFGVEVGVFPITPPNPAGA